MSKRSRERSIW